jgi:hypothetical protein
MLILYFTHTILYRWVIIGPPPFLISFTDNKAVAYSSQFVGVALLGAGVGFMICAAMPAMIATAQQNPLRPSNDLENVISSVFQACLSAGEV